MQTLLTSLVQNNYNYPGTTYILLAGQGKAIFFSKYFFQHVPPPLTGFTFTKINENAGLITGIEMTGSLSDIDDTLCVCAVGFLAFIRLVGTLSKKNTSVDKGG